MTRIRLVGILTSLLLLVAAAPRSSIDDLIRSGNQAFEAKKYAEAVRLYQEAEVLATDPGLVAYNKAAALYQMALAANTPSEAIVYYRGAEEHFRCAAEERSAPRHLLARFGLANSLLQGRAGDAGAIREAIRSYREVLTADGLDGALLDHARHNLGVAKLHLLRLEARKDPRKPPEEQGDGDNKKPPREDRKDPGNPQDQGNPTQTQGQPRPGDDNEQAKDGKKPVPTDRKEAGAGKEKPILDDLAAPPLTAEEAVEELDLAVQRILLEQRGKRFRSSRFPPGGVKDW
jgi:tetratricopeptide (TPR) repeat protein